MIHKLVYTSGTFDLLHVNHLKMLNYAKSLGAKLIVGVNTDELVETYKPLPVMNFQDRLSLVQNLRMVDIAIPQTTLDHASIISQLNIDAYVIGDDWLGRYDYLRDRIAVYYFPYGAGVSSTSIRNQIAGRG